MNLLNLEKLSKFIVFLNVIVSLLGVASFSLGIVLKVWRKEILQKWSGPHLGIIFTGIVVTMVMNVLVMRNFDGVRYSLFQERNCSKIHNIYFVRKQGVIIDLDAVQSRRHPVERHPFDRVCGEISKRPGR
ncbi:Uncharacterised protein r2_g4369 [Pycnogonum litorale]